ncbi:hypothetical protein BDZ89DRAFT_952201, partial [Hymenopellis radicata]
APWVFTRVCRRWRNLAIHSPALWAVIAFDSNVNRVMSSPEHSLAALSLWSERARFYRNSLSIDLSPELLPPLRSVFHSPPSFFSYCTQLQVVTTEELIYELRDFISCLELLSFLELDLQATIHDESQPNPLVLCHESAHLSAL